MVTIFMNSGNIKTSDPQRLLLNLSDKKTQRERMNMLLYQTLVFTIHGKILQTINLRYQLRHGMKSLNNLMIIFWVHYQKT